MFNYRLIICAWRYIGKASQYLCVAICANKPGEAIFFNWLRGFIGGDPVIIAVRVSVFSAKALDGPEILPL
jgi:hypothetical protein